jgi:hypothetical protein
MGGVLTASRLLGPFGLFRVMRAWSRPRLTSGVKAWYNYRLSRARALRASTYLRSTALMVVW